MHMAGLRLTILVIALQAAFLGTGGAVCLDAWPAPWLQADCPDPCCNTADECCPGDPTPVPSRPFRPALPDCCISGSLDYGLPGQDSVRLVDPPDSAIPVLLGILRQHRDPEVRRQTVTVLRRKPCQVSVRSSGKPQLVGSKPGVPFINGAPRRRPSSP